MIVKLQKSLIKRTVIFEDTTQVKDIQHLAIEMPDKIDKLIVVTQRADLLPELCMALPGHQITELKMSYGKIEINPSRVAEAHGVFNRHFNKKL